MAKHAILVTGDYIIDHHLYEGQRHRYGDRVGDGVREVVELGGAALEHDLLQALYTREKTALEKKAKEQEEEQAKKREKQKEKQQPRQEQQHEHQQEKDKTGGQESADGEKTAASELVREPDWEAHQAIATDSGGLGEIAPASTAYTAWGPHPASETWDKQKWHAKDPMGFGFADPAKSSATVWSLRSDLPAKPSVLAISDRGMGFRNKEAEALWLKDQIDAAGVVVLTTTEPVAEGALWNHLVDRAAKKLVVIVSVRDLRKSAALISAGLSWDKSVSGVLQALEPGGLLAGLTKCRHLIVTFDSEGALWFDLDLPDPVAGLQSDTRAQLVYQASAVEGDPAVAAQESAGFLSCVAAAVSWELRHTAPTSTPDPPSPRSPNVASALDAGLCAARDLREKGHGFAWEKPTGFPADRLAGALAEPAYVYSRAPFVVAPALAEGWSLVQQANSHVPLEPAAYDLGRFVLERGPIALANVPHVKVGRYITADRYEVESLRVLIQVVERYRSEKETERPLSLGIFGSPGAGKSFAVKELAKSLGKDVQWMEFNLSQFASPADLIGAFHQIRDQVLQQKLPVAFFDEFDSQQYFWLKYLLAPMQDGRFQEGPVTHALGKSILVMAGGTSPTFAKLGRQSSADAERAWELAKGPDFKSRLDAYLDVVGPNARDAKDTLFPVRRALMIRSSLKSDENETLAIDPGLIRALLHVGMYVNGSRSLTKVVQSLAADRGDVPRRSSLMPMNQLAMHTDAREFVQLCEQGALSAPSPSDPLTTEQIARIAPAINKTYQEWFDGDDWETLTPFLKESNRAAAGRMIGLLRMVHLRLEPGAETDPRAERAVRDHIEYYLEAMAKAEHDGWAKWHRDQGWQWTPDKKDEERKRHPCLRPYAELKTGDANKDRRQVRAFPDFARAADMRIVFSASD